MAQGVVDTLPEELLELVDDLVLQIEDFPDEAIEQELDLDDRLRLLALYRDGREISPGVEKKSATEDSVLIIFVGRFWICGVRNALIYMGFCVRR